MHYYVFIYYTSITEGNLRCRKIIRKTKCQQINKTGSPTVVTTTQVVGLH